MSGATAIGERHDAKLLLPRYTALADILLAFLLADVFTPRTAHSAMSINLCNHSGPDFEKIAARF
jgi:hypothetical protein